MIETENESLRERVSDLEKKALDQGDEIVCLRSTLADVLRRLTLLENAVNSRGGFSPSSTGTVTPVRNGGFRGEQCVMTFMSNNKFSLHSVLISKLCFRSTQ